MSSLHISLAAEQLAQFGPFVVTNSTLAAAAGSLLIFIVFYIGGRRVALQPGGRVAHAVETVTEALLELTEHVVQDRAKAERFFPLLMTFFIFIVASNWLGLLPGFGSITITTAHGTVPLFRGATADLNTTLALAIISVGAAQLHAIRELGLFSHLKKYLSWNPILLFVGVLELVAEFSKMISFSFRLYGNIFAGEVLLAVISFLLPLIAPLPFLALELFVGLVQALVFTMLTLVFLSLATAAHGEHNRAGGGVPQQTALPVEAVSS